jgi:hypothetical protein
MTMPFRVVALIAGRNENDVIGQVVADLIAQGIDVYYIDDGSTDGTADTVEAWTGKGVIGIERRPFSDVFHWRDILKRKEQLAAELDAAWFIHHDADEFRQAPFPGKTLREAIQIVDELGYNAIDFRVLNFRPTIADQTPSNDDVRTALPFFEPAEYWETPQVKAWKKMPSVDLSASGGHDVQFDGRVVCPVQFLVRHYPVRSQTQGVTKIFGDRRPRFLESERELGWHIQYDALQPGDSLLRDPASLTRFNETEELRHLRSVHRDTPTLEATRKRLEDSTREIERLAAELGQRTGELAGVTADLAGTRALLADERRQAAQLQDSLMAHAANLEDLLLASRRAAADASDHHTAVVRQLEQELAALYASKSWRITAPLRWAYGAATSSRAPKVDVPHVEPASSIAWGDLATVSPISANWGLDRGTPVDRYFIEGFLRRHASDIRGTTFEIKDAGYSKLFGGDRVVRTVVIDVDPRNPQATLTADLTVTDALPASDADCFILTQTVHIIFNYQAALANAMASLRPGGVLLCTLPAVSRVNYEDGGLLTGDYWRFTRAAVDRVLSELDGAASVEIATFGNVRTCAAFLYGLAAEDLTPAVLDFHDPWFPLIHCARVVKRR